MWNEKNLFTGCVDVPLTEKGVEEAIEAGKRITNMPIDIVYTSALVRSQMTAMLALTEHHCMKVLFLYSIYHSVAKDFFLFFWLVFAFSLLTKKTALVFYYCIIFFKE